MGWHTPRNLPSPDVLIKLGTRILQLGICGLIGVLCNQASAGFTFIGPFHYQSIADSPFDHSGLGSTFFVENFEDLTYPPGIPDYNASPWGNLGSSVDADDGSVDNVDNGGRSVITGISTCAGFFCTAGAGWDFDTSAFGQLPTFAGIVITASEGGGLYAIDSSSADIGFADFSTVKSKPNDASDDWFIGVLNPSGIAGLSYQIGVDTSPGHASSPARVDHLQYGIATPEPSGVAIALIGGLTSWTYMRWRA